MCFCYTSTLFQVSRLGHGVYIYLGLGDAFGHGHFMHILMAFRLFFWYGVFRDSLAVTTLHILVIAFDWIYYFFGSTWFYCLS